MHSSGPESSHDLFSIDDNPYQAPQSAPEPPAGALDEKRTRWFRVGAILQIIAIILGTVAAFVDIESIVVSGPIVLVLGLITAILALRCRHDDGFAFGLAFGLSGPGIFLVCFLLIYFLEWSPSDAQNPVSKIILTYSLISLPFGLAAILRRSQAAAAKTQTTLSNNSSDIWI